MAFHAEHCLLQISVVVQGKNCRVPWKLMLASAAATHLQQASSVSTTIVLVSQRYLYEEEVGDLKMDTESKRGGKDKEKYTESAANTQFRCNIKMGIVNVQIKGLLISVVFIYTYLLLGVQLCFKMLASQSCSQSSHWSTGEEMLFYSDVRGDGCWLNGWPGNDGQLGRTCRFSFLKVVCVHTS